MSGWERPARVPEARSLLASVRRRIADDGRGGFDRRRRRPRAVAMLPPTSGRGFAWAVQGRSR